MPRSLVGQFFHGLAYPLRGLSFLRRHRLWHLAAAPLAINVVLLVGLIFGTWTLLGPMLADVGAYLESWAPDPGFLHTVATVVVGLFWVVAFVLVLGLNAIVLLLIGQAVASPFLDILSERVETLAIGTPEAPFGMMRLLRSIWVAVGDLVGGLVLLVVVNLPLFLVSLTGIGAAPAAVLSFAFSAMLLSHEFVGLSLARQLVTYRGRWKAVRAHPGLSLGFGSAAMLLLMVPVLNLVLLPLASVGGTLLYCDLRQHNLLPILRGREAGDLYVNHQQEG